MPIYEYACPSCGRHSEILQSLSEPPATECPECGKPGLEKLVSAAGFRLKGGGWYETDFKSNGKKNLAGDAAAASTGDTAKSDAGDSKAHGCAAGACGCASKTSTAASSAET